MMAALLGLTSTGALVAFDSSDPATVTSSVAILGLAANESLVAIDFRLATGELYGVSNQSKLYVVDTSTGQASLVGQPSNGHRLRGTDFGAAFDPDADRLRVVGDADQNFRLHASRGVITGNGTRLKYASQDVHAGDNPNLVAVTFVPDANGGRATLVGIDSQYDILVGQGAPASGLSPNSGKLTTLGSLGVDTTGAAGLATAADGTIYAALQITGETASRLYTIDVATGHATEIGQIGGSIVHSLAAVPSGPSTSTASTDDERFVNRSYADVLGRRADAAGLQYWSQHLAHGMSRGQLAVALQGSAEARARIIDDAFMSQLGRDADATAKTFWLTFLAQGGSARQLEFALLASDEYYLVRCHGAVDEFIDAMYEDVLQRSADNAGRDFFRGFLASGHSRSEAARLLQSSPEAREIVVRALFQWHLSRDADTAAVDHFSRLFAAGMRREYMALLLVASDEYNSL